VFFSVAKARYRRPAPSFRFHILRFQVSLRHVTDDEIQHLIEDATFDYTMGDNDAALAKLGRATAAAPESFAAWHALAEINFSLRRFDDALAAAEQAHRLRPDDLFINTTLSRIWMEKGDKPKAEHFGAQAKIQSWKDQLKNPDAYQGGV
jgi:predicted Zn-dependent protease